ncbi:MAG: hypothetical protein ABEJ74_00565 [Haloferacaceae archaeon]
MDLRTLLSAVLGVVLGAVLLLYPSAVIRMHTAGRVPPGRDGDYGAESTAPRRWRLVVRAVGAAVLLVGCYFAVELLA